MFTRTRTNGIWIGFLALALSASGVAEELLRVPGPVVGFADQASRDASVLLLSKEGQAYWVGAQKSLRSVHYRVESELCRPATQATAMDSPGMTLAYPFLVGIKHACRIDEGTGTIRLIASLGEQLPANAFSVSFAGDDAEASYFVINGRPWETEGYLLGLTIQKKTRQATLRKLVTGVPGYSGAMAYHGGSLWITVWEGSNSIYQIDGQRLLSSLRNGASTSFAAIAEKKFAGIEGLSLYLVVNEASWLYFNGGYGSYLVEKRDGARAEVSPKCEPIVGVGTGWLLLCDGQRLLRSERLE